MQVNVPEILRKQYTNLMSDEALVSLLFRGQKKHELVTKKLYFVSNKTSHTHQYYMYNLFCKRLNKILCSNLHGTDEVDFC